MVKINKKIIEKRFYRWLIISAISLIVLYPLSIVYWKSSLLQGLGLFIIGAGLAFMLLFFIDRKLPLLKKENISYFILNILFIIALYVIYGQILWINFINLIPEKLLEDFNELYIASTSLWLIFIYRFLIYLTPPSTKILKLTNLKQFKNKLQNYKPKNGEYSIMFIKNLIFSGPTNLKVFETFKKILVEFIAITAFISGITFAFTFPIAQLSALISFSWKTTFIFLIFELWLWLGLVQYKFWK